MLVFQLLKGYMAVVNSSHAAVAEGPARQWKMWHEPSGQVAQLVQVLLALAHVPRPPLKVPALADQEEQYACQPV